MIHGNRQEKFTLFCLVYNVDIQFEFCGTKVFVTRDQDEDSIIDSYFHARSKIINFREV